MTDLSAGGSCRRPPVRPLRVAGGTAGSAVPPRRLWHWGKIGFEQRWLVTGSQRGLVTPFGAELQADGSGAAGRLERRLPECFAMHDERPLTPIPGGSRGAIPTFVATPAGPGPWSGVVVVHDALGMTTDLRRQALWLADAGYLAAAPNLFHWAGHLWCLVRIMRDLARGAKGPAFDDLSAVRQWLASHPQSTGRVGIIGFCLGGGFALMLAPRHGYDVSSVNYGDMRDDAWSTLADACPIVASYGRDDPTLKGAAVRLEHTLTVQGIPHDVKEYAGAGHGFMNDHASHDTPWVFRVLARVSRTRFDAAATADARRRIIAFFDAHLKVVDPPTTPRPEGTR